MSIERKRGFLKKLLSKMSSQEDVFDIPKEEQISIEVVYEPDVKDAHGHWASKDEIRKAVENFNAGLEDGTVHSNLFHRENTTKFEILKSWINEEVDVIAKESGQEITAGTWLVKIKYTDDTLWEWKKKGVLKGVSIGGAMAHINPDTGELTDITFNQEDLTDD